MYLKLQEECLKEVIEGYQKEGKGYAEGAIVESSRMIEKKYLGKENKLATMTYQELLLTTRDKEWGPNIEFANKANRVDDGDSDDDDGDSDDDDSDRNVKKSGSDVNAHWEPFHRRLDDGIGRRDLRYLQTWSKLSESLRSCQSEYVILMVGYVMFVIRIVM